MRLAEGAVGKLHGAKIAVLGLAFKAGTDDLRESSALSVIGLLHERGAVVTAYDPIVKEFPLGAGRFGIDVDVFNALNSNAPTSSTSSTFASGPAFGYATAVVPARIARIGARFRF